MIMCNFFWQSGLNKCSFLECTANTPTIGECLLKNYKPVNIIKNEIINNEKNCVFRLDSTRTHIFSNAKIIISSSKRSNNNFQAKKIL